MSSLRIEVDDFNTWNKGEGHTYFRCTDGVCMVVLHGLAYEEDGRLRVDKALYKDGRSKTKGQQCFQLTYEMPKLQ